MTVQDVAIQSTDIHELHSGHTMMPRPISNTDCTIALDPRFTSADEQLRAWAENSEAVCIPAVKEVFCRAIMNPDFVDLCKAVSGMWETEILKSKM